MSGHAQRRTTNASGRSATRAGARPKTGATCFWTALDEQRTDGVMPALDVSDGDSTKLDALARSMQLAYEGDRCVACHDGDPFVYTPHLEGVWRWDTDAYRFGPYKQVRIAGSPTSRALARWMPHPSGAWGPSQDAAVAHIAMCCATPDAPSCRWEPIP